MPSSRSIEEEDDAVPLTDLLRTGEASRLRRRGALRSGHRREESEESTLPPSRRVRIESADRQRDRSRDGQVYLELSCGIRTAHFHTGPSSSSQQNPLPDTRRSSPSSDLGFVYSSTGCGTVINSAASPGGPGSSWACQVYISTDTSNPEVARLPSKYLDPEQRSVAAFLSREDAACKCDWEAIGCRICGNSIGFLHIPCHSGHSVDPSRTSADPTHVFFPSSVTPSPSYTFPSVEPSTYGGLPRLASSSVSDDTSIDSPVVSPRIPVIPDDDAVFRFRAGFHDFFELSQTSDSTPHPTAGVPGPSGMTTRVAPSTSLEEPSAEAQPGFQPATSNSHDSVEDYRHISPADARPSDTRQPPAPRMSTRHSYAVAPRPRTSREVSDDEWNAFLERDRAPSSARRHFEGYADRPPRHSWVPRELRERPPGALIPGERAAERLATMTHPEPSERRLPHFIIGAPSQTRPPDPPTLHRVPRRSLSAMVPPSRRTVSLDSPSWRSGISASASRSTFMLDRQEHAREFERGMRMSRWSTMPIAINHPSRRQTPSTVVNSSTPAFTLVDSAGERSFPPSAQSSLDDRDTLSVDSDAGTYRGPGRHLHEYFRQVEPGRRDVGSIWGADVHTEEPEADDEEKAEDEPERDVRLERDRRSPLVFRNRELILDEQSVSSLSQLPLG